MSLDEEDWLDDQLLADDLKSSRWWRREASNKITKIEAMQQIPLTAQLTCRIDINSWRRYKRFIDGTTHTQAEYVRHAIGEKMVRDGVPSDEIEGFLR